ncbi:hypothetical protein [Pseudonocardia sp. MH-G8]|uniref:hypothetical protein n=1 Tax=Pseudonocardia sp. MH-G8 TaxID=1854588 RepID=UPI000B9FBAF8|nr:hypothetical protein [Pseudonocardia sp. MH-G8]OZM79912.1 hypothetical protein CFP66_23185 [Pseudonocardia sp. MH-G8]
MPAAIAAALESGVDPRRLEVAAHEVGHGIVWHHGGIPIRHMAFTVGIFGGISDGECRRGRCPMTAANAEAFLIGFLAGAAAQHWVLTCHLGAGNGSARRTARHNSAYDIDEHRRLARAWRSPLDVDSSWSRAASILARHERRLDALTARLATSRRLSGSAL